MLLWIIACKCIDVCCLVVGSAVYCNEQLTKCTFGKNFAVTMLCYEECLGALHTPISRLGACRCELWLPLCCWSASLVYLSTFVLALGTSVSCYYSLAILIQL